MKVQLFLLAVAASICANTNAERPPDGDIIRIKSKSSRFPDQVRIITKPRPGYDPVKDTPLTFYMRYSWCRDDTATTFLPDFDDTSACCRKNYLDGYKLWAEKDNVAITTEHVVVNHLHSDAFQCLLLKGENPTEILPKNDVYNSYLYQVYAKNKKKTFYDTLIEFPAQDIIAVINRGDTLDASDAIFALGGGSEYLDVRDEEDRGSEIRNNSHDHLKINCEPRPSGFCHIEADTVSTPVNACKARVAGDPHMTTFDGLKYDVHVKGELTVVQSTESNFEIQMRTEAVESYPGRPAVATGVVIREADKYELPTIQVSMPRETDSPYTEIIRNCPVQLYVDGTLRAPSSGSGTGKARVDLVDNDRIVVQYADTRLKVNLQVKKWEGVCLFNINFVLANCRPDDDIIGLLGSPNDKWRDDWMYPNGTLIEIPNNLRSIDGLEESYNYSKHWCITDKEDSAFTYEPTTSFETYSECIEDYDPTFAEELENASEELKEKCNGDLACLIDGETIGTEAVDDYLTDPKNHNIELKAPDSAAPTAAPTSAPSSGPSSGPTSSPSEDGDDSEGTDTVDLSEKPGSETGGNEDAGSKGDPHFKTWNGEHFEFHGQCDLVLAHDENFADGVGLDVQIRTKVVRYWSYIKSAAIRLGDDILEVQGSADAAEEKAVYWYNFEYRGKVDSIGGFPVRFVEGTGRSHKHKFVIDLSSKYPGQSIVVATMKEFVKVDFINASELSFGNTIGMLGDFKTGELRGRDDGTINDYNELGLAWQVLPADGMLFHDIADPQFPKRCVLPEDPQGQRRRRLEEATITVEQAEAVCAKSLKDELDIKDCVYDILATQDFDMVGAF